MGDKARLLIEALVRSTRAVTLLGVAWLAPQMMVRQLGFNDPGNLEFMRLISLYDLALSISVMVVTFVFAGLLGLIFHRGFGSRDVTDAAWVEVVWTAVPAVILVGLAIPSITLLYAMDELVDPQVTVKAIGHQWYWSYELGDFDLEFDSYMAEGEGVLRLLEVDKRLVLPTETRIRVLVSSSDVIHSWAIPALGVKTDGIPGRLNQVSLWIDRPGVYRGMCSELCGVNHAFMPIVVEAVPFEEFMGWVRAGQAAQEE